MRKLARIISGVAASCATAGLFVLAPPAEAANGVLFEVDFYEGGRNYPVSHASVWVSNRRVRIEQKSPNERRGGAVLIYRGDLDRFYSLDPRRQVYVEVDRKLITSLGKELIAARREVDMQLERLPSDQRRAFERLLGVTHEEDMANNPLIALKTGERGEAAGLECRKMDLTRGDEHVGEACVVSWARLGLQRKDVEVFRQLANFQRELMGAHGLTPLEIVPNQPLDLLVQLDGFPLRYERKKRGYPSSIIRVASAERMKPDDALFEVPEGYVLRDAFASFLKLPIPSSAVGQGGSSPASRAR
jgi:hypothetical protein